MTNLRYETLALKLEASLIPGNEWTEEKITNFPEDVQTKIRLCIPPYLKDDSGKAILPHPTGIGHNEEVGWFCLGVGQGPFIIWLEKDPYK